MLCEMVIHESIHALDLSTLAQDTVLVALRRELTAAGRGPSTPEFRDVPHTVMFVEAGEVVRRVLDAAHKHYGDVEGYYAKVPQAVSAVREPWIAYLDKKTDREAAIRAIVSRLGK